MTGTRACFVVVLLMVGVMAAVADQTRGIVMAEVGSAPEPPRAGTRSPGGIELPPGGEPILGEASISRMRLAGDEVGRATLHDAEGPRPEIGPAVRVDVRGPGRRGSAIMLATTNAEAVSKGDALVAEFWARSARSRDETAESTLNFFFEAIRPPPLDPRDRTDNPTLRSIGSAFASTLSMHRVGPGWRYLVVPFRANADYGPGEARLGFDVAFADQAIEVAGLRVLNYGKRLTVQQLPRVDRSTYAGRAPDAPWRAEAAKRIERIRKGEIEVKVVGRDGLPLEGATVRIDMQRHAFAFGTAIDAKTLLGEGPDHERYRQHILELFNTVVFGNDLKWPQWEMPEWRARVEPAMRWLEQNRLNVRGHVLLWGSFRFMPEDLKRLADDPPAMRRRIIDAARERTTALRGRIAEWDCVNEPYTHTDAANVLGDLIYAEVFKAAREGDPHARLFINDFGILSGGGMDTAHQAHYERTIQGIIDAGGDLGGIGFQGHFGGQVTEPDRVLQILDRYARFGVPLQVTEFDVDVNDPQLRADYTRDLMITLFSHEAVTGFVMWGFWEGQHWKPRTAMIAKDWSDNPNGVEYRRLVLGEWWTRVADKTGRDGIVRTRGFLGEYRVTVEHDGRTATRDAVLTREGLSLRIDLE